MTPPRGPPRITIPNKLARPHGPPVTKREERGLMVAFVGQHEAHRSTKVDHIARFAPASGHRRLGESSPALSLFVARKLDPHQGDETYGGTDQDLIVPRLDRRIEGIVQQL